LGKPNHAIGNGSFSRVIINTRNISNSRIIPGGSQLQEFSGNRDSENCIYSENFFQGHNKYQEYIQFQDYSRRVTVTGVFREPGL